jgi:hypothetical protein
MSDKKKFTSVYQLEFDVDGKTIPFYIGMSEDTKRREGEHRTRPHNPSSPEYDNYKYQWIRELDANNIPWRMNVLSPMVEDSEDSEYSWVLRVARNNKHDGIKFYDDLPLTNMKAGSLLSEMLDIPELNTAEQIRAWRERREQQRVSYEAAKFNNGRSDAARVFGSMGGFPQIKGATRTWVMPPQPKKAKKKK